MMKKAKLILTGTLLCGLFSHIFAITCPKPEDIILKGQYWEAPENWSGFATYTDSRPEKFIAAVANQDSIHIGRVVLGNCKYETANKDSIFLINSKYTEPYNSIIINTYSHPWILTVNNAYLCSNDASNPDFTVDSCPFDLPPSN